jgi:sensor domain CHASE-containing protein
VPILLLLIAININKKIMDSNIQFLIGICVVEVIVIEIIVTLYFSTKSKKNATASKKCNEVDEEIENELRKNT